MSDRGDDDRDGRGVRPRLLPAPVQQVAGELHPERLGPAACDRGGDGRGGPDETDTPSIDQLAISTAQPPAVPPGAADGRGPSARLTAASPR